jgi:hypothetical protein
MRLLLAILALLLPACLTAEQQVNDCLPAAIAAREIMQKQGVPAKVLVVHWREDDRTRGHAYAVFSYGGKRWSYDKQFGSIPLTAGPSPDQDHATWEAWEANLKRGHRGEIREAYYLQ